jgi:hypothetical protein
MFWISLSLTLPPFLLFCIALNIQNKTKKRKRYIKNFKQKAIGVLPADTDLNKVDVWFQDETNMPSRPIYNH